MAWHIVEGCVCSCGWVQFPDPHWKMRNRKKRIVQPQLVQGVADLIAPSGRVFLQSDVQEVRQALQPYVAG